MPVILAILKLIGILLLVLVGVVLLLCAAVLFVPVRYSVTCQTEDSLQTEFSASWLMRVVRLRKGLSSSDVQIYLFGINIRDFKGLFRKKKEYKDIHVEKSRVDMVDDFYEEAKKKEDSIREEEERMKVDIETDYEEPEENVPDKSKKSFSFDRISSIITFIRDSEHKSGLQKIKKELVALLRYLMPYYVRGKVVFGTGDPCTTGWILGIISMFPVAYTDGLKISPDFEDKVFEADVNVRGKLHLIYFLRLFVRGYLDEDIKKLIGKALKK